MKTLFLKILLMGMLLCAGVFYTSQPAWCVPSVSCNNPVVSSPSGGGTTNVNVLCTISSLTGNNSLTSASIVVPSTITLTNGANTLSAVLQSSVTSPNGRLTNISGSAITGFSGSLSNPTATVQFTYRVTTTSTTPGGSYVSTAGAMGFNWSISSSQSGLLTGTANATLQVNVPTPATTVSCSCPGITAPAGGGAFTMTVTCTVSNSGSMFSPAGSNLFSPVSLTLTSGSNTLNATLQSTVSSPDASVTGISGTASGGFSGNIQSLPATIRAQYTGNATSTTPAGTYNSGAITYTWSVL